jgi:REP element-mobilizing transposase RayT
MPKKNLIRSSVHPYHVTARCNNREPFFTEVEVAWRVFSWHLNEIAKKFGVKIHAFVLMPNHFHLLISTPQDDLGIVMQRFMSSVTKTLNSKSGRTGRVFGGRYHWSLVDSLGYYDYVLKYIYRNPVKAGLSAQVEDYPFSTMSGVLGNKKIFFPLHPPSDDQPLIPSNDLRAFLDWMNEPFRKEQDDAIRKGFKKKSFSLAKTGWKRLPARPESIHDERV